jgi:hypothetical protein
MATPTTLKREQLEQLRPLTHLRGYGCLDDNGEIREDLAGNFATAACIVFEKAELAPQELLTVCEAIKQCLAIVEEDNPARRLEEAVDQALDVAAHLLNKEINDALVDWIYEWFPLIESDRCIDAFMHHLNATTTQYAVIIGLKNR